MEIKTSAHPQQCRDSKVKPRYISPAAFPLSPALKKPWIQTNEWCISSKVAAVKSGQVGRKFRCSEKTVKQQFCSSNFVASILQVGSNFAAEKNGRVSSKFTAAKNVKLHVAASCCSKNFCRRFCFVLVWL